jgi:FkbM family methyltransferase
MKGILWKCIVKLPFLKKPSIKYSIHYGLLPSIVCKTTSEQLREQLFLPKSSADTQLNQDIFALLINRFRKGYFVEIGANDGFTLSNTLYLEENFGWTGLLVEANPKYLTSLSRRRNSYVINKAISDRSGMLEFIDGGLYGGLSEYLDDRHAKYTSSAKKISVHCVTLNEIFDQASSPAVIDFISIDVEGGELPIISQLISSDRRVRCGCIEMNYRIRDIEKLEQLLYGAGYKFAWEGQTGHDVYFVDPALI